MASPTYFNTLNVNILNHQIVDDEVILMHQSSVNGVGGLLKLDAVSSLSKSWDRSQRSREISVKTNLRAGHWSHYVEQNLYRFERPDFLYERQLVDLSQR